MFPFFAGFTVPPFWGGQDRSTTNLEVVWMMESLSIDKKLAADLMAFLDEDDSGDVTWVEFVRGVSNGQPPGPAVRRSLRA